MKREYADKLISMYPEMFMMGDWRNKKPSVFHKLYNRVLLWLQLKYPYFKKFNHINESNPFRFGFECDDGWRGILAELILKIKELDYKTGEVTKVFQIKEKFGGLRFYPLNAASTDVWELITEYEEKSYTVCEVTGSTVDVGVWTYGWIHTMSKEYAKEYFNRLKGENRIANGLQLEDCWKYSTYLEDITNMKLK